jgi:hypothetical protein
VPLLKFTATVRRQARCGHIAYGPSFGLPFHT